MPLKVNVGLSRKVGEANYGSRGGSINVEMELDTALVNDPPRLQERIRHLFGLVRASLVEELNGNGNGHGSHAPPSGPSPAAAHTQRDGNGNGPSRQANPPRPATQSQVKAIYAIARSQGMDVHQLLRDRFNVGRPDDLTVKEASQMIDSLKSSRQESS